MPICTPVPAINVGTWIDFSDSDIFAFVGFTLGNGTVNFARYTQLGQTVLMMVKVTLGSTSVMGLGNIYLPVPAAAPDTTPIGEVLMNDTSASADFGGGIRIGTGGVLGYITPWSTASTYTQHTGLSSTVPMTWATGDSFYIYAAYEAA